MGGVCTILYGVCTIFYSVRTTLCSLRTTLYRVLYTHSVTGCTRFLPAVRRQLLDYDRIHISKILLSVINLLDFT